MQGIKGPLLLFLILVAGVVVAQFSGLKRYAEPREARAIIQSASEKWWVLPVFIGAYAGLTLIAFPGSLLTLTSGALFGIALGIVATIIGATLGASASFGAGRFLGRQWIEKKFGGGKKFETFQTSMQRRGFLRVLQLRLIPLVPFNLLNFACGVTRVGFLPYFFATMIGMLPGTAIYVYVGYSTRRYWIDGTQPYQEGDPLLIHVIVSITLLVLITLVPMLIRKVRKGQGEEKS